MDVMLSSRKKQRLLSGETEMYELQYVRSSSGEIFYSDLDKQIVPSDPSTPLQALPSPPAIGLDRIVYNCHL